MKPRRLVFCAAWLWAAAYTPAQAGRSCEARLPEAASVQRAMGLAERTVQALEASGAQVVVLARNGQDLSKYRLRWSHLGLAYREAGVVRDDGVLGPAVWRVVHKLNECGSARGDLYRQGLGEFFLDDLFEFKAGWAVPPTAVQERLLLVQLRQATLGAAAHCGLQPGGIPLGCEVPAKQPVGD